MKGISKQIAVLMGLLTLHGFAAAQSFPPDGGTPPDWFSACVDPKNTTPVSGDFTANVVENSLMLCTMSASGTWTAGGGMNGNPYLSPCFSPPTNARTIPTAGKFCFSYGDWTNQYSVNGGPVAIGSIQRYSPNFDPESMALNFGAPSLPSYCYANLIIDNKQVYFGAGASQFYAGESNRYMSLIETDGPFTVHLQVELLVDAIRFRWMSTNNDTNPHTLGLWFGSSINMLTDETRAPGASGINVGVAHPNNPTFPDAAGAPNFFNYHTFQEVINSMPPVYFSLDRWFREEPFSINDSLAFLGIYVYLPNQRPPTTDVNFDLVKDPLHFPDYADFVFGQTDAFGFRIETKPSTATTDTVSTNIPTKANMLTLGKENFILREINVSKPLFTPTVLLPDTDFLETPAFVLQFPSTTVAPGANFQFLNYVRSNWGNGSYSLPYGAVVDAPKLVQAGATNYDGTPAPTGLIRNPATIRVWIDNVGGNVSSGYGVQNKEFPLSDININLSFGVPNVTIAGGGTQIIPLVNPRQEGFRDFKVTFGPDVIGHVPYTVTINSTPGPTKTITGTIVVAGRPRTTLYPGANLITAPQNFSDGSWTGILQNFLDPIIPGATINTYTWNANQTTGSYQISLGASRGNAAWVIYHNPANKPVSANFGGNPSTGPGFNNATVVLPLYPGWNMIANPFNIEFPISQINGTLKNGTQVYTFNELVSLGYIGAFVAMWDPVTQSYIDVDGASGVLQPNVGYWINVPLQSELDIQYPPLFTEGSPDATNKARPHPTWALNLQVRQGREADLKTTVGVMAHQADVRGQTIYKAPMAPTQKIQVAIVQEVAGKKTLLHQAVTTPSASYAWNAVVDSTEVGDVLVTWPNVSSVPRTLGVFLIDEITGITTDMRNESSYRYTSLTAGRRQFQIVAMPVIAGNIIRSLSGHEVTGTKGHEGLADYDLSIAATTKMQVLSGNGKVIATLHDSRLEQPGKHEDTWNLKGVNGLQVPAGSYTLKLSAMTSKGVEQTLTAKIDVQ